MTQTLPAKPRIRVPARRGASMEALSETETAYHGASTAARDMASWQPWRISPDAALMSELDTLVARSDDLARNNGIASGAERTQVDNIVGPRTLLKPNPDRVALEKDKSWADEWSAVVESKWKSHADTVWFDAAQKNTFHGQTRLQMKMLASAGEGLALPLWLTDRGSMWNTTIQLVDPARLSNPDGRSDTATLRGGIEFDRYGAPIAYHVRKSHPGDFGSGILFSNGTWERIPAYTSWGRLQVVHFFEADRVGQSRGKPFVAAVMRQFKMFDKLMLERLRQSVLDSMVWAAMETPLDQETFVEMFGGDKVNDYQNSLKEWRVQMKGGAVIPMPPGTKLNPFMPSRGASDLDATATIMLRQIATGLNMPYELLTRDFSKSNYSSARAALLEGWRYFLAQRQLIADGWASPMYELWFEEAVNRGEIPDCTPDDFYSKRIAWTQCKWIWAGRGWVDPLKEAQASGERMSIGVSTLEDENAEQGKDWRQTMEQRATEIGNAKKLADDLGIDFRLLLPAAAKQSQPKQQTQPDDNSPEDDPANDDPPADEPADDSGTSAEDPQASDDPPSFQPIVNVHVPIAMEKHSESPSAPRVRRSITRVTKHDAQGRILEFERQETDA